MTFSPFKPSKAIVPSAFLLTLLLLLPGCQQKPIVDDSNQPTSATALPAGISLLEEYAGDDEELSVPYSKYRLDNGLTVILHEDHSDPMVHVDVAYHVGSNREEPGRSGFAHFFEHMMFEGSRNVAEGALGKIISNAGGSLNGTTNSDRTNYYETIPVNQLEIALWLEADRIGFLLEAVDQEKFEVQRETVKNERGQRVDNVPYGRLSETMMKNLYPPEHPYSWPVIGWMEDLDAASLEDLERFFLRWYGPNNAQLVIGGDIDQQQTLQWVAKYFGSIPAGPEVEPLTKQAAQLDQDRYVTLEDNVHLPAIAMLFPTVYYNHPDEAPLDAAAQTLGGGRASLLYQRLVQSGRAVSAYVSHACRELACLARAARRRGRCPPRCRTLPCALNGGEELCEHLLKKFNTRLDETTPDGRFTVSHVECIASCGTAPVIQINDELHEAVTLQKADELLSRT